MLISDAYGIFLTFRYINAIIPMINESIAFPTRKFINLSFASDVRRSIFSLFFVLNNPHTVFLVCATKISLLERRYTETIRPIKKSFSPISKDHAPPVRLARSPSFEKTFSICG